MGKKINSVEFFETYKYADEQIDIYHVKSLEHEDTEDISYSTMVYLITKQGSEEVVYAEGLDNLIQFFVKNIGKCMIFKNIREAIKHIEQENWFE